LEILIALCVPLRTACDWLFVDAAENTASTRTTVQITAEILDDNLAFTCNCWPMRLKSRVGLFFASLRFQMLAQALSDDKAYCRSS